MKENVKIEKAVTPMLFPFDPDQYWQRIRLIIREEVTNAEKNKPTQPLYETPGLTYKPLFLACGSLQAIPGYETHHLPMDQAWEAKAVQNRIPCVLSLE
jgi:hypothetical protein